MKKFIAYLLCFIISFDISIYANNDFVSSVNNSNVLLKPKEFYSPLSGRKKVFFYSINNKYYIEATDLGNLIGYSVTYYKGNEIPVEFDSKLNALSHKISTGIEDTISSVFNKNHSNIKYVTFSKSLRNVLINVKNNQVYEFNLANKSIKTNAVVYRDMVLLPAYDFLSYLGAECSTDPTGKIFIADTPIISYWQVIDSAINAVKVTQKDINNTHGLGIPLLTELNLYATAIGDFVVEGASVLDQQNYLKLLLGEVLKTDIETGLDINSINPFMRNTTFIQFLEDFSSGYYDDDVEFLNTFNSLLDNTKNLGELGIFEKPLSKKETVKLFSDDFEKFFSISNNSIEAFIFSVDLIESISCKLTLDERRKLSLYNTFCKGNISSKEYSVPNTLADTNINIHNIFYYTAAKDLGIVMKSSNLAIINDELISRLAKGTKDAIVDVSLDVATSGVWNIVTTAIGLEDAIEKSMKALNVPYIFNYNFHSLSYNLKTLHLNTYQDIILDIYNKTIEKAFKNNFRNTEVNEDIISNLLLYCLCNINLYENYLNYLEEPFDATGAILGTIHIGDEFFNQVKEQCTTKIKILEQAAQDLSLVQLDTGIYKDFSKDVDNPFDRIKYTDEDILIDDIFKQKDFNLINELKEELNKIDTKLSTEIENPSAEETKDNLPENSSEIGDGYRLYQDIISGKNVNLKKDFDMNIIYDNLSYLEYNNIGNPMVDIGFVDLLGNDEPQLIITYDDKAAGANYSDILYYDSFSTTGNPWKIGFSTKGQIEFFIDPKMISPNDDVLIKKAFLFTDVLKSSGTGITDREFVHEICPEGRFAVVLDLFYKDEIIDNYFLNGYNEQTGGIKVSKDEYEKARSEIFEDLIPLVYESGSLYSHLSMDPNKYNVNWSLDEKKTYIKKHWDNYFLGYKSNIE